VPAPTRATAKPPTGSWTTSPQPATDGRCPLLVAQRPSLDGRVHSAYNLTVDSLHTYYVRGARPEPWGKAVDIPEPNWDVLNG